jgi:hypothetical protein
MNFIKKVTHGNYEVQGSGTVIVSSNEDTSIVFGDEGDFLTLVLKFENDETKEQGMSSEPEGEKKLVLKLKNFNNPLGTGTTAPLEIGKYHNQKLFFSFMIYGLNDGTHRTVHYTFSTIPDVNA